MTTAVPSGNTYDKYQTSNPIERRMMSGFFTALDACLPAEAPRRVLEVGAGEGEVTERVRQRYGEVPITVIDLPDADLAREWRRRHLRGAFASVEQLPHPDARFDLVLAIEVLEHVAMPELAVQELRRVCDGQMVLSVPREPIWRIGNVIRGRYVRDLGNTPGHVQHWSARSFERMVGRHAHVEAVHRPLPWTMLACTVG